MRVVGLTGSIAMGKSTTAAMFARRGVPVHDADRTVHRLYEGEALGPVETAFPGLVVAGRIDRARLAARVLGDSPALARLEAIVHPLVRASEARFVAACRAAGKALAVLDSPLLLETAGESWVDVVIVVSAAERIQRERLLARRSMTAAKLAALLARQMPDADKRARAHIVIATDRGLPAAERQVEAVLRALAGGG